MDEAERERFLHLADDRDGKWFSTQEFPPALLRDLGRLPIIPENEITKLAGTEGLYQCRRQMRLADREKQVLALLSHGMTARMVADTLAMNYQTVLHDMKRIRYILRAKNSAHACCIGIREGLID